MSPASRILVVDDDADLRRLVGDYLAAHGLEVEGARDAREMDAKLASSTFDLVILDLMMPGEDGLSVLRRWRDAPRPAVIMLSAMGEATDRIVGLEVGADDYLAKPCNPRELLARVRAVLRRREQGGAGSRRERRFGEWTLDVVARSVRRGDDAPVALTDAEFRVLNVFLDRPQRVLTRDQLLDLAKGGDAEAYDRAIDVTVSRLRRKLGGDDPIRTVRGEGYQFDARVHGT
jgi:two-component system OmpR family response regulator